MVDTIVHTAGDGRGPRDVFLNGNLMKDVVYADIRKGKIRVIVRDANGSIRLHKFRKRVLTRTMRGEVVVTPKASDG